MTNPDQKNLLIRVAVAALGIPLLIILAKTGGLPFVLLVSLATFLGMSEFAKIAEGNQTRIPWPFLGGITVLSLLLVYIGKDELLVFLYALTVSALALGQLRLQFNEVIRKISFSLLGLTYLSLFTFWILIRELPKRSGQDYALGGQWMISLFLLVWACDTAAYFGGKGLGKHKLAPQISPGKTVEGAIFGLLGALLSAVIINLALFESLGLRHLFVLAILVGSLGQLGDLFESLLKRSAQLKDTSTLIPGHGGVLDRFDSLLFVSPWVYLYLRWIVFTP